MPKLRAKERNALTDDDFGLPESRKYPLNDESHIYNAEARAKQQLERGNLSQEDYDRIMAKVRRKLGREE